MPLKTSIDAEAMMLVFCSVWSQDAPKWWNQEDSYA